MLKKATWPLFTLSKKRKRIDTNPDYQRPAVWTKAQKQLLIDSILRDFDVPKIYLHEKNNDSQDRQGEEDEITFTGRRRGNAGGSGAGRLRPKG
mgnify:CR=1 FL=1